MQSLEIISINLWQILISLCNLLILFLVLKKFLYKPVMKVMAERQSKIDTQINDAKQDRTAAEAMRAEYEEKLEKAAAEGDQIIKNAVQRARTQEEEILKSANDSAARTLKRAEEQVELERRKAVNQLKDEVSGLAVDIASAVIEKNLTAADNKALIDKFIENLGESK